MTRIRTIRSRTEAGQGMLEYVLVVVFIALAGIVVWRTFGAKIKDLVGDSSTAVSDQSDKVLSDYNAHKNDK